MRNIYFGNRPLRWDDPYMLYADVAQEVFVEPSADTWVAYTWIKQEKIARSAQSPQHALYLLKSDLLNKQKGLIKELAAVTGLLDEDT